MAVSTSLLVMTVTVGVFEAKTKLSELLELVAAGEEVVITKRGEPIAFLHSVHNREQRAQDVLDGLSELRRHAQSGPESFRALIDEGRRYP